jgi:heme A synthase
MTKEHLHHRAFAVTVGWTLLLLLLGSVVHATNSSLACPDWPTCYGTMMPEMEGGIFWEHLHRLVAGGLMLMFALATWLVRREVPEKLGLFRLSLAGMALLFVQAGFGGLTVLLRLPTWVSTTHLLLALTFLSIAVLLAGATSPRRAHRPPLQGSTRRVLRTWGLAASAAVLLQSVLGALVRHMDAGMACPDLPLCLGQVVPALSNELVAVHFAHRVLAVLATLLVIAFALQLRHAPLRVRRGARLAVALVAVQALLGILSVATILAVVPVSLHTLGAASLLATLVLMASWGWEREASAAGGGQRVGEPSAARAR